MAQMTHDLAMESLRHCAAGLLPPPTAHEIEQLLHAWLDLEAVRHQRDALHAQRQASVRILVGIHSLLYPPPVTLPDGRTMVFRDPDPHQRLQQLSDRIRAIPDELSKASLAENPIPVWRVYVVEPLAARQRKHTVMIYRVGRETKEEAIEAVRADILEDQDRPGREGLRIVACTQFGDASHVVCDGVMHWDQERVAKAPTL